MDHHDCSEHNSDIGGVFQTLDEMEFTRGPWSMAVNNNYDGICKYLKNGGDPNARDSSGYTLLHYAARNGYLRICKALITNHAFVNSTTKHGKSTALHRAAYGGHYNIVQYLLDNKSDPKLIDDDGKTALHKAAESGNAECCSLLIKAYPEAQTKMDKKVKYPKDYVSFTESQRETYKVLWWRNNNENT